MVLLAALTAAASLGVACPVPSSVACDRVGVAVFVRERVPSVRAVVAGREVVLRRAAWRDERGRAWIGYVHHAGLRDGPLRVPARGNRWTGRGAPVVRVRVLAGPRSAVVRVRLRPGWG